MRRLTWIALITIMMTLGAGCSSSPSPPVSPEVGPRVGAIAPDFTLFALAGNPITLSGLRGRPVVLNFWTTWCGPCRHEMPYLQEMFEERENQELAIVAVNIGESESIVRKFITTRGYTFPIALDQEKHVALDYEIAAIPTTFLIDQDGIIQAVKIGAFPSKAELVTWLRTIEF